MMQNICKRVEDQTMRRLDEYYEKYFTTHAPQSKVEDPSASQSKKKSTGHQQHTKAAKDQSPASLLFSFLLQIAVVIITIKLLRS